MAEMLAITQANSETVPNWLRPAFRNVREVRRGEKSRKLSHGFSFILTAEEHHKCAKTQFYL
jgi:hypothetical protein